MGPLERVPSLTDQAAREIRARIIRGVFQLGEPLSEIALANDLGVSKTPVREALLELKRQGLVEVHPQRGTFVFDMTAQQVQKLSEVREILELATLERVLQTNRTALAERWTGIVAQMREALSGNDAERYRTLDGAFHRTLFELADNAYLLESFELIAFRVQALRSRLSLDPGLNNTSFEEHVQLAALVAQGDRAKAATKAGKLLRRHIELTRKHYLDAMAKQEPASAPSRRRRSLDSR